MTETKIQSEFFREAKKLEEKYPLYELLFSNPNAGRRKPKTGRILKQMGMRAGIPDVFYPVPRGTYCGMAIEFKTEEGIVKPNQREWIEKLRAVGWYIVVVRTAYEALEYLERYNALLL